MRLSEPFERFQDLPDWPCGCQVESEGRHIHACEMHAHVEESRLWAVLEAMFPDLPEPDPRDLAPERPWPDGDEQC